MFKSRIDSVALAAARPPLPTRFAQFAQLRSRSSLHVFFAYLIGAASLHVAYVWTASWVSRNARLGLFFFHQGCVVCLLLFSSVEAIKS